MKPGSAPQLALVRDEPHGWAYATWTPPTGLAYGRVDRIEGRGLADFKRHMLDLQRALNKLRTGALVLLAGGIEEDDGCALDGHGLDIIHDLEEAGVPLDDVLCRSRGQIIEGLASLAPGSAAEVGLVLAVKQATGVSFSRNDTAPALAVGLLVAVPGVPLVVSSLALDPAQAPTTVKRVAQAEGTSNAATRSETASRTSEYLTPRQVVAEFQISISSVYALAGRIPSHKVPGFGLLFRHSDIIAWIERHRRVPMTLAATRSRVARSGRPGTRRARGSGDEEIIPGLTRDALKAATGL